MKFRLPVLVAPVVFLASFSATHATPAPIGWDAVPAILARIKAPTFPARDFVITAHGAVAGGGRVLRIAGFAGAVIDGARFTDCTFHGAENTVVISHAGSIAFQHVTIEPARKGKSANSIAPAAKP